MGIRLIHLGVGGRGRWPVRMVSERNDFESVALVDIDEDNLSDALDVSGLSESVCFRSLEIALQNVEADAVVVITPPDLHFHQCLEAVRAGKHVLVEKPFTKSLESARKVVEEAEKNGVKVAVSQNARYHPITRTLNRLIREEVYGKARFGLMTTFGWRRKGVHHSGNDRHSYLWERGIHEFDSLRFIFSDNPSRIWGHSFNPPWSPYRGGSGIHAWVEFEKGATCGCLCTFEAQKSGSTLRIDLDEGTLEVKGKEIFLKQRMMDDDEEIQVDEVPDSTTMILNGFSSYINKGIEPDFSGRKNLITVGMVEGLGVSSDEGRVIDFKAYIQSGT